MGWQRGCSRWEDRRVHIYPGNYEDYLWRKQGGPENVSTSLASLTEAAPAAVEKPVIPDQKPAPPAVKRLNPIKLKQLEERVRFAEEELPRLEETIAAAEEKMGVFSSAEESQRLATAVANARLRHAELLAEWEELSLQLEEQQTV